MVYVVLKCYSQGLVTQPSISKKWSIVTKLWNKYI